MFGLDFISKRGLNLSSLTLIDSAPFPKLKQLPKPSTEIAGSVAVWSCSLPLCSPFSIKKVSSVS
jgi:hypothetical protein